MSFVCPIGGRINSDSRDEAEGYCAHCHVFPSMLIEAANVGIDCGALLPSDAPCSVDDVQRALGGK